MANTPPPPTDPATAADAAASVLGDAATRLALRGLGPHLIFTAMAGFAAGNLARCSGPSVAAEELRLLADLLEGQAVAEGAALLALHPAGRA